MNVRARRLLLGGLVVAWTGGAPGAGCTVTDPSPIIPTGNVPTPSPTPVVATITLTTGNNQSITNYTSDTEVGRFGAKIVTLDTALRFSWSLEPGPGDIGLCLSCSGVLIGDGTYEASISINGHGKTAGPYALTLSIENGPSATFDFKVVSN